MKTITINYEEGTDIETFKELAIKKFNEVTTQPLLENIEIYSNLQGSVRGFVYKNCEFVYDYLLKDWFKQKKSNELIKLNKANLKLKRVKSLKNVELGDIFIENDRFGAYCFICISKNNGEFVFINPEDYEEYYFDSYDFSSNEIYKITCNNL